METDEAEDHANGQGNGLCVRHERLQADYERLRQSETDHQSKDSGSGSTSEEEGANLEEVRTILHSKRYSEHTELTEERTSYKPTYSDPVFLFFHQHT